MSGRRPRQPSGSASLSHDGNDSDAAGNTRDQYQMEESLDPGDNNEEEVPDDGQPKLREDSQKTSLATPNVKLEENLNTNYRNHQFLIDLINNRNITCIICIEKVRFREAIWSCERCYYIFHLECIEKWAQKVAEPVIFPQVVNPFIESGFSCPQCRLKYPESKIPEDYYCFCGKTRNPPYQSLIVAHSCGELCSKPRSSCNHTCVLLCHPGPCPPCTAQTRVTCYCGKSKERTQPCVLGVHGCGTPCGRTLACGRHRCAAVCHPGPCPPCAVVDEQPCRCGAEVIARLCTGSLDAPYLCQKVCGRTLDCGAHKCEVVCHPAAECGPCPRGGAIRCPCGKTPRTVRCPDTPAPCEDTCDLPLECGLHKCPHRCHPPPCPPCMVPQLQVCRCRGAERVRPCSAPPFRCERRCGKRRAGCRHACSARCCPGSCAPCDTPCNRLLNCNKHRCTRACHGGACPPCQAVVAVSCACGRTVVDQHCIPTLPAAFAPPPPHCTYGCNILYACNPEHGTDERNWHPCHKGPCPPCKAECGKLLKPCNHRCPEICHQKVKVTLMPTEAPRTPCEIRPPTVKEVAKKCNPCMVPVEIFCKGQHRKFMVQCSLSLQGIECTSDCGKLLPCENHVCSKQCHDTEKTPCGECTEPCVKSVCSHGCPRMVCHAGDCEPCREPVPVSCYCGIDRRQLPCREMPLFEPYSCGGPCPKSLPCGHHCRQSCHTGDCAAVGQCTKKVKVNCRCRNLKKEFKCFEAQAIDNMLSCDESCKAKLAMEEEAARQREIERQKAKEEQERREYELYMAKFGGKKKQQRKEKSEKTKSNAGNFYQYLFWFLAVGTMIMAILAFALLM